MEKKLKNNKCNLTWPAKALLASSLALAALLALSAKKSYEPVEVRVKLCDLEGEVTIRAKGLSWSKSAGTEKKETALLSWDGRALRINNKRVSAPVEFKARGPVSVDNRHYRGRIKVTGEPPCVVNRVDLQSYVAGVINQEIDSRWPEAAVDAQAVLVRTYALKRAEQRKDKPYDLEGTVTDQVYGGVAAEDDLARAAARRTRGKVLTFRGELVIGHYHSCCGGRTELPGEAWGGKNQPFQKSVSCRFCQDAPRYFWRFPEQGSISGKELSAMLGMEYPVQNLEVGGRDLSGRVTWLELAGRGGSFKMSGKEFRKKLGYEKVFSTAIQVEKTDSGFVIRGSGSGHGVGMCQWGARGMAEAGFPAEAILGYYFPGTKVLMWNRIK